MEKLDKYISPAIMEIAIESMQVIAESSNLEDPLESFFFEW